MNKKITEWLEKREIQKLGGGPAEIEKQHTKGKLTARERINLLFDEGSFVEIGLFVKHRSTDFGMDKKVIPGDGCIAGFGTVNGRTVYVFAHDFTANGGTLGEMHCKKIIKITKAAIDAGAPCISLNDSGGGRIQEPVISENFFELFYNNVTASGWIPQISAIMGPCAGGPAYSPALCDFIISVDKTSSMFLTGPAVIKEVTGEEIDAETLGGATLHNSISGVSHLMAADDRDCINTIKELLSYLPQNAGEKPPRYACADDVSRPAPELDDIIPEDMQKVYDVKQIIEAIVDDGKYLEHQPMFAKNIVTVLARMNGQTVGIVANQPKVMAGSIDINASDKGARFIRICDSFNIPLIWLVDVPGFLPGIDQERGGVIRHGAKLLYACCEATVPKITLTLNKNYGGATAAMCAKEMGCDINFMWPTGHDMVMGAAGAVKVVYRKEISATPPEERAAVSKRFTDQYRALYENPYLSVGMMENDEIIMPSETRKILIQTLEALKGKESLPQVKKKHGNMPV
ncbi:MAG: acyl-CoA carboxylase subunit beta [Negativicutes bacterium]|nr:acyl-CoA carboxylase subunit beta [Negativicutes bacterium]